MPAALRLVLLVPALLLARVAAAQPAAEAPPEGVVAMRFGWVAPLRARVTFRQTRLRPGAAPEVLTARYELRVEALPDAGGLRLRTVGTTWRGDLPYPPALARDAIRATDALVQRVEPEGRFAGLDGVEGMRPVLARVFESAKAPPQAAARAMPLAEAAIRAGAEELWNLSVGFWNGADLRVGEAYALAREGEIPLVSGERAPQQVEFAVRRRVPCAAAERGLRCVEATLRQTSDRAAVERAAALVLPVLLPDGAERPEGPAGELSAEAELVLVTDPATLLPRRLVWTRAVRLGAADDGPPGAEEVVRDAYDWAWLPPEPPHPAPVRRRTPPPRAPAAPSGPGTPLARAATDPAAPAGPASPPAAVDAPASSPGR